jgi:hypothetical protein
MIEKIGEDAYFVVDNLSFISGLSFYDPIVSNQTICFEQELETGLEHPDSET